MQESIRKSLMQMLDARERDDRGLAMAPRPGVARQILKMMELHHPTAPLREHRAHLSELEDPDGAKVDDMDYCDTTTGQSPTIPAKSSDDWMVHFVTGRDPYDRGFYEHEAGIELPADGELSPNADEFEVLCSQIMSGGLIPGFPDAIGRRYSPRPTIIAQDVTRVDFAKRSSRCGVVFRRSEFVDAGASDGVIPGRPDLWFDDLLAWDTNNISAEVVRFRAPDGEMGGAKPASDPISEFLTFNNLVEPVHDGEDIGRYRFDLGIQSWCGPKDQRAMFEAAAGALEHRLGLGFTVRGYPE